MALPFIVKHLVKKAREENLGPDDIQIYAYKNANKARTTHGETVSKAFNSLAIPGWVKYSLFKYGKPMIYHGMRTRSYTISSLMALFGVVRSTIYSWVELGVLPKPALKITPAHGGSEQSIWLYHQVRPTYVWQQHIKARGIPVVRTRYLKTEIRFLKGQIKHYDRLFHKRMGLDYVDPYTKVAGKYGVIWMKD